MPVRQPCQARSTLSGVPPLAAAPGAGEPGKARSGARALQVIVTGDLNIAASQLDVHANADYSRMYSAEEKRLFGRLLECLTDTWRLQHPDAMGQHTVWDEKTSARAFNRGCVPPAAPPPPTKVRPKCGCHPAGTTRLPHQSSADAAPASRCGR